MVRMTETTLPRKRHKRHKKHKKQTHPKYIDACAGASAGFFTRLLTAPLDLLKIRLQLTPNKKPPPSLKTPAPGSPSINTMLTTIHKNEGIPGFFKGNVAATYLWVTYAAIQFTIYSSTVQYLNDRPEPMSPPKVAFAGGAIGGLAGECRTSAAKS